MGKSVESHREACKAVLAAVLLPFLNAAPAWAASPTAAFLKIPLDARAVGLGGGIAALAEGVGAVSENPAGFGLLRQHELSLLYAPHLQGTSLDYLAYGRPTRFGSMGMSHLSLRSGGLDGRDDEGRPTGSFSAEDRAIGLSWAAPLAVDTPLFGRPAVGVQAKHVSSRIGSRQGSTFAFDVGAQSASRLGALPVRLGLAIRNLGSGLALQDRRDPLPLLVSFGAAAQPLGMLTVSAGGSRHLNEQRNEFSLGAEVAPLSGFFFRGNYGMLRSGGAQAAVPQLSWGMGLRLPLGQLDYAFMPLGELGSTQRLNLTMRFGAPATLAPALPRSEMAGGRARAQSLVQLAWESLREGRLAAAAIHFQRAADAEPANVRLAGVAARAQEAASDLPAIEGAGSPLARRGAAAFVDGRDLREAVVLLRQAYERATGDARLLALLNRAERAAKEEITGKPVLARSAGFVEERLRLAKIAIYDGNYELGARRAAEALEIEPKSVQALAVLGSARYLLGSKAQARQAWERALALDPANRDLAEYLETAR